MFKSERYALIEKAIHFLESNFQHQPELEELAAHLHISPHHLQRIFREWVGISPKKFLQFLTIDHARLLLRKSRSILDTSLESGLSGPGRLHDLFITIDAVTPGEYKQFGSNLQISYGFHDTPFGICLLAVTERGICGLYFVDTGNKNKRLADFHQKWRNAKIVEDKKSTAEYIQQIFSRNTKPVSVFLLGTNFQIKVWEALLKISSGQVCAYEDVSRLIRKPRSQRAVGSALAANPVSYLIPCHRVIQKSGNFGHYAGGDTRKKVLIAYESAQRTTD